MTTKNSMVIGANRGIGFGIIQRLCKEKRDWKVFGTCRSDADGIEACRILAAEGHSAHFYKADLLDKDSLFRLADVFRSEHGGVDVLVLNAAVLASRDEPYSAQVEQALATNVFGTQRACEALLPLIRSDARLVFVSSGMAVTVLHKIKHTMPDKYKMYTESSPPLSVERVLSEMREYLSLVKRGEDVRAGWPADSAYAVSKLGVTLLARAYAHQLRQSHTTKNVVVNACCPGYVATRLNNYTGRKTIDQGADTPYYLATLPDDTDVHGEHVSCRRVVKWS